MASPRTLEIQKPIGQRVRAADPDRLPLPGIGSWPRADGVPVARSNRRLGTMSPRAGGDKPRTKWGWRVERGARPTRVTDHGGRAHTVYSFAQAPLVLSATATKTFPRGRAGRRGRIADTKARVTS